ncbi:MAG TPA: TonB-dependent receptor [Rhodanobacter sp.]|nr:TonB-dependent receptor [Rhodanobacter sp.]
MNTRRRSRIIPNLLAASVLLALAGTAAAQETQQAQATNASQSSAQPPAKEQQKQNAANLSQVIVTGTRTSDRTQTSSLVPVDVIPSQVLNDSGAVDLGNALDLAVPSLNFPLASMSDTFAFVRPFQMRGLNSDQVLILVDGKRWHSSALMLTLGQVGQGSQGVNINTIPIGAIDHIEVLRDGASAQYGSDALAGVINIILKKGAQGGDVQADYGKYSAGDGASSRLQSNIGFSLGEKGWVRISAQVGKQDPTNRAGLDNRPGFTELGRKYQVGIPNSDNYNTFINWQYDFTPKVHLYGYGHYGRLMAEPMAFYRYGTNAPEPKNDLMQYLFPDGDGFNPVEHGVSRDKSFVTGLRGETEGGWSWDTSAAWGANRVSYGTFNTVNFAFWNDFGYTPKDIHDGTLTASQATFDFSMGKSLNDYWHLGFGAQYLYQGYKIVAGDLASYYVGTSGVTGGAQGFAGWGPDDASNSSRHSVAEYAQLEGNITDKLSTSLAVRHEDYSDFGTNLSYALSGRFDFDSSFALRGTVSTGFRAPGLGQQHASVTTSVSYPEGNSLGLPEGIYLRGLVPVDNKTALLLGSEPLKPETSRSYTIGAVWTPTRSLTTTVDLYDIQLKNRILMSSSMSLVTDSVKDYLAANGIVNSEYVALAYFTNAAEMRIKGIGVVTNYLKSFDNGGTFQTTVNWSYHKNKVTKVLPNPAVLDALGDVGFQRITRSQEKGLLADQMPRSKFIWTNTFRTGNWGFTGTAVRYGGVTEFSSTSYLDDDIYPSKWLFNLAVNYYRDRWTFTLGSDNVFNTYPQKAPDGSNFHGIFPYPSSSPFGAQGAYVYGKVVYRW